MDMTMSMQVMAGMCLLVLAILFFKSKIQIVFTFLVRAGMGAVVILCMDKFINQQGSEVFVGLNLITLLTSGTLGFPGVAVLFAISALKFL